jgi:hypothetical protein
MPVICSSLVKPRLADDAPIQGKEIPNTSIMHLLLRARFKWRSCDAEQENSDEILID